MPVYTSNGRTYNIPDNLVGSFLASKKDAQLVPDSELSSGESNISKQASTSVGKSPSAQAYAPESGGIAAFRDGETAHVPSVKMPQFDPDSINTELQSGFRNKSFPEVVRENRPVDPNILFEGAIERYQNENDLLNSNVLADEKSLPPIAREWLEKRKVETKVPMYNASVMGGGISGYQTVRRNTPEDIELARRFIGSSPEGRVYREDFEAQKKQIDDAVITLKEKIKESEQNAPRVNRMVYIPGSSIIGQGGQSISVEAPENYQDIETARSQLLELERLQKAYEDRDINAISQFFNELGRRSGEAIINAGTLGLSKLGINYGLNKALQNPDNELTKEANDILARYQYLHNGDRSIAQDIAKGVTDNADFIAQFAATGGIASALTKGTATAIAKKLGGNIAAKAIGNMSESLANAFVRTSLMPSTLATAYELNTQNPGSFLNAYAQAFGQNFIENFTEGLGEFMPTKFRFLGKENSLANRIGKYTGFQGLIPEFAEEQIATILHSAAGDGQAQWSDLIDPRSQLVTLGTISIMQLPYTTINAGGYASGKFHNVQQKRSINKGYQSNLQNMQTVFGEDAPDIVDFINQRIDEDPEAGIPTLMAVAGGETEMTDAQKDSFIKYGLSYLAYSGLNKAKTEEVETATQEVSALIEENANAQMGAVVSAAIGGFDTPVQIIGGNIAQREDGSIDRENSDKQIYYLDADGNRQVISIDFVESVIENIPVADAITQATELATAPIIAQQENEEVRPYEIGDVVRVADGYMGEISGIDDAGNYIMSVETPQGIVQMSVEPRRIVNEDNLRGVENGNVVAYLDANDNVVEGVVDDMYSQRANGLIFIDGELIPVSNIAGLASEVKKAQQPAIQESVQEESTEQRPEWDELPEIPVDKEGSPDFDKMSPIMLGSQIEQLTGSRDTAYDMLTSMLEENRKEQQKQMEKLPKKASELNKFASERKKLQNEGLRLERALSQYSDISGARANQREMDAIRKEIAGPDMKNLTNREFIRQAYPGGAPNVYMQVLFDIINGQRFVWNNQGNKRGIAEELGKTGENEHRQGYFGILASPENGGITFDDYVHAIYTDGGWNLDDAEIRDQVIGALNDAHSPGEAANRVREIYSKNTVDLNAMNDYYEDRATYIAEQGVETNTTRAEVETDTEENSDDHVPFQSTGTSYFKSIGKRKFKSLINRLKKSGLAKEVVADRARFDAKLDEVSKKLLTNNPDVKMQFARTDRAGNIIGDGDWHISPTIIDFSEFPNISTSVSESASTESVYVTYTNNDNGKKITVRFSFHENNAVKFGDQLNGFLASKAEVLYHLGLRTRKFIPRKELSIARNTVGKKVGNYERSDFTLAQLFARGEGASLEDVKGKLLKDRDEVIVGGRVNSYTSPWGDYVYDDVSFMTTPIGDIYGFVAADVVYLDSSRMNANTPIHEFGHLWNTFIKENNPELWARGSELIRESEYWQRVNDNPAYSKLTEEQKVDESLAMAIGDKGEVIVNRSLKERFADWLKDVWSSIKDAFGVGSDISIEDMTLGDFTDLAVGELLSSKDLSEKQKIEARAKIQKILDSTKDTSKRAHEILFPVSKSVSDKISELTGLDVSGYKYSIDKSEVNHAFNRHSNRKIEESRGQIPLEESDLLRLPEILENPDEIRSLGKDKMGRETVEFSKRFDDGTVVVYEAVLTKQKEIAFQTMFKKKPSEFMPESPTPTSETTSGFQDKGNTLSANDQISKQEVSEMEQIKQRSIEDGTFMKAPNGEPTNLTERQWLQVRTSNFKEWFGDWENDSENASKVIDENGEPKAVYHGTREKGFTKFTDTNETDIGFFFSSSADIASSYQGDMDVMELFLNISTPKIIDGKGRYFNEIGKEEEWSVYDEDEFLLNTFSTHEDALEYIEENNLSVEPVLEREFEGDTTDDLVVEAKEYGIYDGVIFENIIDASGEAAEFAGESTVIVAFNPNQIKSATANTGEFSKDVDDIRFQSVSDVAEATGSTMTEEMRKELDVKLKNFAFRLREAWEDKHLAVKNFLDTLRKEGIVIAEHNDYYKQATHLNGKIDAQLERYNNQYQKPLNEAIRSLEDAGLEYRDIENYVILKHGQERNKWMRQDAIDKYMESHPDATTEEIERYESRLPDDYSGVSAILTEFLINKYKAENPEADMAKYQRSLPDKMEIEQLELLLGKSVEDYISEFEQKAGAELIDNLWKRTKDATSFALNKQLEGGLIDKNTFDDLTVRYEYYVPLRGHDAETAEDRWDYSPDMGTYFVAPLAKARGRRSRSESPFAYVASMAQSAINSANRNILNQTILRLARKDLTGLMSANKVWYVESGRDADGIPTYEAQSPTYSENPEQYRKNIEEFNERMKKLESEGMAYQGRKKLDIGGIFIKRSQADQHEVHVYQNGEEFVVYINANPAVARAINGSNAKDLHKDLKFIAKVSREMAANFTTRNPIFVLSNFSRDYIFASSILGVKEDARYALQFQKNMPLSFDALQRYVRGKADLTKSHDRYLNEYILNGAKTGFSHIVELQRVQKQIERDIKQSGRKNVSMRVVLDALAAMNDVAENMSRLSVYITSREQGRSITQSVSDAKEVTVNFNRSGAGGMGSQWVRPLYLFVNAGIQALSNFAKVAVKNPKKAAVLISGYVMSGFLMPFFASLLGGDEGEEEYWKLSDWERENNLCIYTGSGFIKIPLPHELRVFHKMGNEIHQAIFGKKDVTQTVIDTALGFADLVPANPFGAVNGSWAEIMPDALKPVFQIAANTNFTGSRITNEWADPNKPGYLRIRTNKKGEPYAPVFLVKLAEGLDTLTGGDGVEKGIISLNPDVVNHIMRGYFGGLYGMVMQGLDAVPKTYEWAKTGELKLKVRETPLRTFYSSSDDLLTTSSGLNSRYFKIADDVKEALRKENGYKEQVKDGKLSVTDFAKKVQDLDMAKVSQLNTKIKQIKKYESSLKELEGPEQRELERIIANLKGEVVELNKK